MKRAVTVIAAAGIVLGLAAVQAQADITWAVDFGSQSGQVVTDGTAGASVAPGVYNVQSVLFNTTDGKTIDTILTAIPDITWDGGSVTDVVSTDAVTLDSRPTVFDRMLSLEASGLTSTYVDWPVTGTIDSGATTWTPTVIPEPASLSLLGLGGLLARRRRRS